MSCALALIAAWLVPGPSLFQGGSEPPFPQPVPPIRILPPPQALQQCLPVTQWDVRLDVHESSIEMSSEQTLHNPTGSVAEATFLYPLPRGAVARELELWINGKPVSGEVLTRDKASEVYQSIVRRMRDPALLEFVDHDLLRASIFPIQPNTDAKVRIRVVFTAHDLGALQSIELPLYVPAGDPRLTLHLDIAGARPVGPVFSPSHALDVVRKSDGRVSSSYEGRLGKARRATLYYGYSGEGPGVALLCNRGGDAGHFQLTLYSPRDAALGRVPRDVVFVLDRSGSMKEGKLEQAIAAMKHGIGTLDSSDRFEIISFATEPIALFRGLSPADAAYRAQAVEHLSALRPSGGTALCDALLLAIDTLHGSDRMPVVVFLTDGEPTIGETDTDRILQQALQRAGKSVRLFTFGVGYELNARLLDRLGEALRGASDYVLPEENLEVRVSAFFDRISEPALENVKVTIDGVSVEDVYPKQIHDLFAGSALHLFGRYRGFGPAKVTLEGTSPRGPFTRTFNVDFPADEKAHDAIRPLYAARKVAFLMDQIRLNGPRAELKDEVIRIGREYGIVTPFTSALVVEEGELLAARTGGRSNVPATDSFLGAPGAALREAEGKLELLGLMSAGEDAVRTATAAKRASDPSAVGGGAGILGGHDGFDRKRDGLKAPEIRHVGNKVFLQVGETWIDRSIDTAKWQKRRTIDCFSDEYFALLRNQARLREYAALGTRVIVEFEGTIFEFTDAAKSSAGG